MLTYLHVFGCCLFEVVLPRATEKASDLHRLGHFVKSAQVGYLCS